MLGDLTEKIQSSQNKFEQLVGKIPGYSGYKQKEQRREADKLLRLHVARQYDEQLSRLNRIQYQLTSAGDLTGMMLLERAVSKLQLLVDRIRTASYGYAGLFDALKVDEDVLDKLYEFDQGMLVGVDGIAAILDELEDLVNNGHPTRDEANKLIAELERLHTTFGQRQEVILR
jgi:hypothetical protein